MGQEFFSILLIVKLKVKVRSSSGQGQVTQTHTDSKLLFIAWFADIFSILFKRSVLTIYTIVLSQEGRTNRGDSVSSSVQESDKEKEKKKKSLATLKSMTQVTKAWGNRLSPKLEKKKIKSKVALMKVYNYYKLNNKRLN